MTDKMLSKKQQLEKKGQTLFDKIWKTHTILDGDDNSSLLYIDRIMLHERTGAIALKTLQAEQRAVRDNSRVFCTIDHIVDTFPNRTEQTLMPSGEQFIRETRKATNNAQIKLFDIDSPNQGIVHVISPELGIVLPGLTLICPDSHTCSQGAIGALAWGIGSSQAEHALATQTLRVNKPENLLVEMNGALQEGTTAYDLMLHLISRYGANGGNGFAIEFAGNTVKQMDLDARMTLCNMAVEFSAFTAIIAPDEKVLQFIKQRPYAPSGDLWKAATQDWQTLRSDSNANFKKTIEVASNKIAPMVTWGTSPEHACNIDGIIPNPLVATTRKKKQAYQQALNYQELKPGQRLQSISIDAAFIGSCTNGRLSDLRNAAQIVKGRTIAPGVQGVVVPGSKRVKRLAEQEGLDRIFKQAGFQWREPGCSMCFYAGGETFGANKRIISTTNRNFEGRQGPNTKTHLANPLTVAASALSGKITDPRPLLEEVWRSSSATAVL